MNISTKRHVYILGLFVLILFTACSLKKSKKNNAEDGPITDSANTPKQPNVLFIVVDDLNDFPGFMNGNTVAKTPHMDRLANQGMVFTNAHAQFPLCGPSRASFMSGMLPSTLNYAGHMRDREVQERVTDLDSKLLHTYFAEHGYKTMAVGKILHDHVPDGSVDLSGGRLPFNEGTGRLGKNWDVKGTQTDWAMAPEEDEELADYKSASWAVKQLASEHNAPFFMMVGFLRPHVPWYVPKKWFDLYNKGEITTPPFYKNDLDDVSETAKRISILPQYPKTDWAIENNEWKNILHAYLASTSFVDHQVGRVLNALEASAYKENTIIVLLSDHGYHLGEKNTFQKETLWERSSHSPLIIAGPQIEKNRCEKVVSLLDIYPTLTDLCELPANKKVEGHSLLPLLKNPENDWKWPSIIGYKENSFAIQTERYRYLRYNDGSEELYDHQNDINEWYNLADKPEMNAIKNELAKHLPN